ncbi:MAG: hypothetical protein VB858_22980 [Planctomycetaceae bacterium]
MRLWKRYRTHVAAAGMLMAATVGGCGHAERCDFMGDITPMPLGTFSDPVWRSQEGNAEASDFVVYESEWRGNSAVLGDEGKSHVKQIAVRAGEQQFPILVEPSSRSVRPDSKFKYPTSNDSELDARRRALIVEALQILGVADADARVIVSRPVAPGSYGFNATRNFDTFSGFGANSSQGSQGGGR